MDRQSNDTVGRALAVQKPGMGRPPAFANLAYSTVGGQDLALDVYLPVGPRGLVPVVLLGGPPAFWAGKNSGQKAGWAQLLAASGLGAVTFDHRSDQFLKTPLDPIEDVAAAITHVHTHGPRLGVDAERMALMGFSVGTGPWHVAAAMRTPRPYVRALVLYYTLLDFDDSELKPTLDATNRISARLFLETAGASFPRTLVVMAGRERFAGINASIGRFVDTAKRVGANVELLVHADGEHGFDTQASHPRTTEIVNRTVAFLQSALE